MEQNRKRKMKPLFDRNVFYKVTVTAKSKWKGMKGDAKLHGGAVGTNKGFAAMFIVSLENGQEIFANQTELEFV